MSDLSGLGKPLWLVKNHYAATLALVFNSAPDHPGLQRAGLLARPEIQHQPAAHDDSEKDNN